MKIGFTGEAFGNLIVLLAFIGVLFVFLVVHIAYRRGIDITKHRFALTVGLIGSVIFIVIPVWLTALSFYDKVISTALSLLAGIGNYYYIDRLQSVLKKSNSQIKINAKNSIDN